jgi:carboxyl-terminal processing protease
MTGERKQRSKASETADAAANEPVAETTPRPRASRSAAKRPPDALAPVAGASTPAAPSPAEPAPAAPETTASPTPPGWPSWPAPPAAQGWPPPPQGGWRIPPAGPSWPTPPAGEPFLQPAWTYGGSPSSPRPSRLPQVLIIIAVALLSFSAGMVTNQLVLGEQTAAQSPAPSGSGPLANFSTYEEALRIIRANYVDRSNLTDQQLLYGSIRGMVDSLGDIGHTVFLTPEEYQSETSSLDATYGGIGVVGTESNGMPAVERVLPDSPAEKAGLKAGDQILAVDGVSTSGKTFADVAPSIRGKVGTQVTLTIVHAGSTTPVDVTITRQQVKIPLVEWGMVPGTHVADIALFEFSTGASDQLQAALSEAEADGATAIVLDLRGNPGGYVAEAQGVGGLFLPKGVLYIQENASGARSSINVDSTKPETNLPMVVLVDHSTASAAEIVAGALQDAGRARIIGLTTVGTGTVLQVFPLNDGSAIALATAEWLTPNGNHIFGKGITPDQLIALPSGVAPTDPRALASMTAAEFMASTDSELLAAVQYLGQ